MAAVVENSLLSEESRFSDKEQGACLHFLAEFHAQGAIAVREGLRVRCLMWKRALICQDRIEGHLFRSAQDAAPVECEKALLALVAAALDKRLSESDCAHWGRDAIRRAAFERGFYTVAECFFAYERNYAYASH